MCRLRKTINFSGREYVLHLCLAKYLGSEVTGSYSVLEFKLQVVLWLLGHTITSISLEHIKIKHQICTDLSILNVGQPTSCSDVKKMQKSTYCREQNAQEAWALAEWHRCAICWHRPRYHLRLRLPESLYATYAVRRSRAQVIVRLILVDSAAVQFGSAGTSWELLSPIVPAAIFC